MDVEEPTAASTIIQALSRGREVSLRTAELTAVAVLKGEIIIQLSKDVGQRVAFQTVRDRVRAQLDTAADDPDLPELFEFMICIGVGKNSYIDDLLEVGGCFVDSKKRQLRFSAFTAVNKMCKQAPWAKIAVFETGLSKTHNGFCPSPEAAWGDFEWDHLQTLEEVLRFFHGACRPWLDKVQAQSRSKLLANIDVAATDTFFGASDPKQKKNNTKKSKTSCLQLL